MIIIMNDDYDGYDVYDVYDVYVVYDGYSVYAGYDVRRLTLPARSFMLMPKEREDMGS